MALPGQMKSNRLAGSSLASTTPTKLAELEAVLCDIFGFTIDTNVTATPIGSDNAGIITKALLRQKAAGPVGIRFRDSTSSKEFRLVLSGTDILFDENTGTEGTPVWTNRLTIAVATGNITHGGATVWDSANDGAASGLDADKLDGVEYANLRPYVQVADVKSAGTGGGGFVSGAWQQRVINSELVDSNDHCVVASNQITLSAGTYECKISCSAYAVDGHRIRLYNATGAAVVLNPSGNELYGTTEFAIAAGGMSRSEITGKFVIAADQALQIQHRCETTNAVNGQGRAANVGIAEVYLVAEFWKVA
jgi:hypothetical protein